MQLFDYDDSNIKSVYSYAKKLEGMTFNDILEEYERSPIKKYGAKLYDIDCSTNINESPTVYGEGNKNLSLNSKSKGQLGNFIEKYYFGYEPNGKQEADLSKIGVEIKQTPIDMNKKGEYHAGERLSITNISYKEPVEDDFYKSHVWEKIRCILLIQYLRDKSIDRLDYVIKFVNFFSPPKEDLKIIMEDYRQINEKIKQGKADELSEGDTLYLGACTKGATAEKSKKPQYYGDHTLARKRNFCFKISYMNYVLRNYILKESVPCESIVKSEINENFIDYVIGLIERHIGKTDKELCCMYNRPYNNNKAQWKDLSFRMLGIKSNQAAEFEKANIVVKTIRIEENGIIKENMSFAPFKFRDLLEERWENSQVFNFFESTQYLFVNFKKQGDSYTLIYDKLCNNPYKNLNEVIYKEWDNYRKIIKNGIIFKKEFKKNGKIEIKNNLPGMKDTEIIHIRPHAQHAAYKLKDGFIEGNIKRDADELPNGEWMTKQSFWLNRDYVLKQLKSK